MRMMMKPMIMMMKRAMLRLTKRRRVDNDVEPEDGDDHHGHE